MSETSVGRLLRTAPFLFALVGCGDPPSSARIEPAGEKLVLTELSATGWGTLRGRVVFEGSPPERPKINPGTSEHGQHCESPDLKDETWVVDPSSKGVAHVVVWLEAPEGTFFPRQPRERKTWSTSVVIDQPKCMFEPHVVVVYPEHYDAVKQQRSPTDQKVIVRNSSGIIHQAEFRGSPTRNPGGDIRTLPAKTATRPASEVTASLKPDKEPITVVCGLHQWMKGYVRAFDHPYAAVSERDGTFELKNVPAGAKLRLRTWHEAGEIDIPEDKREITIPPDGVIEVNLTARMMK